MMSQNMYKLAELAKSNPHIIVEIRHTKRKSNYQVIGFIKNDIDNKWHQYIAYRCLKTGEMYSRHAMNFKNFVEI